MKFDPEKHHRRSIRLQGYNYAETGAYFITVCTQNRECVFGEIVDGEIRLNDAGRMVEKWWAELMNKFPSVEIDEYIVMPNHFHGIVVIVGAALCGRPGEEGTAGVLSDRPRQRYNHPGAGHPHRGAPTLGDVVDWFKTMTTNDYIRGVKQHGWLSFPGKLWQRNYYERIIRDDEELLAFHEYIINNPLQWELDQENPLSQKER